MIWTGWNESSAAKTKINNTKPRVRNINAGLFLLSTSTFAAGKPDVVADHMSKGKPGSGMALPQGVDNRVAADSNDDHCQSYGSTSRLDHPRGKTEFRERPMHPPTRPEAGATRQPA